jgi:hypothetical protein
MTEKPALPEKDRSQNKAAAAADESAPKEKKERKSKGAIDRRLFAVTITIGFWKQSALKPKTNQHRLRQRRMPKMTRKTL